MILTKSREFNRNLFRADNNETMMLIIKLCLMAETNIPINEIADSLDLQIQKKEFFGILMMPDRDEFQILNKLYQLRSQIQIENKNSKHNIGIISVTKNGTTKPEYRFSAMVSDHPTQVWLLLVDYSNYHDNSVDPTQNAKFTNDGVPTVTIESKSQLAILGNKAKIFFTTEEVNDLLKKYKLKPQYYKHRNVSPNKLLKERKSSMGTPLEATGFQRLKHNIAKRVHKVGKKIDRVRSKTVSLSKSKGSFTRKRGNEITDQDRIELMAQMKERFGHTDEHGAKQSPVYQEPKTKVGSFLEKVGLVSRTQKVGKEYRVLKQMNFDTPTPENEVIFRNQNDSDFNV